MGEKVKCLSLHYTTIKKFSIDAKVTIFTKTALQKTKLKSTPKRDAWMNNYRCDSNLSANASLGWKPTTLSTTSPFFMINKVGILITPYFAAVS